MERSITKKQTIAIRILTDTLLLEISIEKTVTSTASVVNDGNLRASKNMQREHGLVKAFDRATSVVLSFSPQAHDGLLLLCFWASILFCNVELLRKALLFLS